MDLRHEDTHRPALAVVVQPIGKRLSLAKLLQHLPSFAQLVQHRPQLEPDVESLLQRGMALRQCLEDAERLLEPFAGFRESRPVERLEAGVPEIVHGFLAQLTVVGMMCKSLNVFAEAGRGVMFR
jgi:hypothetical protein